MISGKLGVLDHIIVSEDQVHTVTKDSIYQPIYYHYVRVNCAALPAPLTVLMSSKIQLPEDRSPVPLQMA